MIRIAALNDESAGTVTRDAFSEVTTKEAQEEAAFALYNKALQLQNDELLDEAESVFKQLLSIDVLRDVVGLEDEGIKGGGGVRIEINTNRIRTTKAGSASSSQSLLLKYSAYKNLANIACKKGEYEAAMESYLEATCLDPTDVTVWYRTGLTALKIQNYPLAKVAFLEGLKCNSAHWPCLDNVVTVLYALNNYYSCLYYIGLALEKDAFYSKGLAIRDKIYEEQPGLRKEAEEFFINCDESIHTKRYDKKEGQKCIDEALEMRRIKRDISRPEEPPLLNFTKPLNSMTWKNLGESLVDLYDVISKADKPISFSCRVNIARCIEKVLKRRSSEVNSTSGSSSMTDEQSGMTVIPMVVVTSPTQTQTQVSDVVIEQPATVASQIPPDTSANLEADEGHSLSQSDTPVLDPMVAASRKRRKRKAFYLDCIDAASKRRSARVRNTVTKKQPEYVNYSKLLHTFLPSSLILNGDEGNEMSVDNEKVEGDQSMNGDGQVDDSNSKVVTQVELEENESIEVPKFLESVRNNTGVLDIMYKYLLLLGSKHCAIWPEGLSNVFVQTYSRLRSHIVHPSPFSLDYDEEDITNEAFMTLLYCEFTVDKWILSKTRSQNSSSSSPTLPLRVPSPMPSGGEFSFPYMSEDTDFLDQLTIGCGILEDSALEFTSRVFFMKARTLMLQNQMDFATSCFKRIVTLLKDSTMGAKTVQKIVLINCKVDNVITMDQIQKQLESLLQCQSLEELHRLHQAGKDQQVVDLLMPTFNPSRASSKISNRETIPDRHSQLLLLQDALWNIGDQKQCIYGGEVAFNEALHRYSSASSLDPARSIWASTVNQLISKIERCITQHPPVVHKLPLMNLKRFINNLIRVIVIQMEVSETVAESPIRTVVPWILLYYCIRQEEEKIRLLMAKSACAEDGQQTATNSKLEDNKNDVFGDADFGPGMASSLMLLYSAHEHLGRRGLCCQSDGALLLIYADILVQQLKSSTPSNPHPFKEDLEVNAEQCFFCLYGHPNRKKAKHLQEHGATQISLSWIRARPLFDYFKPKQLPEFDSYKVSTISNEVEYLLRRILTLVPSEEDPASRIDLMCAYIEGSVEEMPTFDQDLSSKPITSELYYLLADYYFKNKELGKAIKFYLLDVCVDPSRFNSWAGMALARSSQLEQKLNSCELRSEGPIYRKATAAFRCFERALKMEPSVASLWIENGSLAYMLHSYTCRQLKQRVQFELPSEIVQLLREKRTELLKLAQKCFTSANKCKEGVEEEWLHHYMLGKIAEKMDKPPQEYLAHYKMAGLHLHLEEASYPNRIQYHSPPHLSMEALEVYYRAHASVLKYLLRHEGKPLKKEVHEQLEKFLKDIAEEPFAKFKEKRQTSSDAEDGSSLLAAQRKKLRTVRSLANDHDYFRRKRKNSSSDETNAEQRNNPSADSSSESQDSATVKDLLNSIVSVISERHKDKHASSGNKRTIIVGDTKIYRPPSQSDVDAVLKNENADSDKNQIDQCKIGGNLSESAGGDLEKRSSDSDIEIIELVMSKDVVVTSLKAEASKSANPTVHDHRSLALSCENALKHCLQRFSQHYKSVYRLAHYYSKSKYHKNIQRSHDYLVGPKVSWQQTPHMTTQALFAERKNLNFFNGIWRIPIDEIDRPGSFASHMFRSILLLITILEEARGHTLMVQITVQLHRNPDTGKKYLRDADRMYLANLSYERSIRILLRKMKSLCKEDADPLSRPSAVRHMMDTYQAWQKLQKVVSNPDNINSLLERVYFIFRKGKIDDFLPCFDQAVRFCQHQQFLEKIPQMAATSLSYVGSVNPPISSSETFATNSATSSTSSKVQTQSLSTGGLCNVNEDYKSPNVPYKMTSPGTTTTTTSPFLTGGHVLSSPNLLTADVQSKIKSLDPVEPFRMQASKQMSGFQLEFLRQINASMSSQSQAVSSSAKPEGVVHQRTSSSYSTLLKDFEITLKPVDTKIATTKNSCVKEETPKVSESSKKDQDD